MRKIFFQLLILFCVSGIIKKTNAQSLKEKENNLSTKGNSKEIHTGFIKATTLSPTLEVVTPDIQQSSTEVQQNENQTQVNTSPEIQNTIPFNYSSMPPEVQKKIDSNKASGKNILDGIIKGYRVEIKSCNSESDCNTQLNFLNNEIGFIRYEFVSAGVVNLIVNSDFDSVALKQKLFDAGVAFNFLTEYFLLK